MATAESRAEDFEKYGVKRSEAAQGARASFEMPDGSRLDILRGCFLAKLTLIPDVACAINAESLQKNLGVPKVCRGRLWQYMASFGNKGFTRNDLWELTAKDENLYFGPGVWLVDLYLLAEENNFFETLEIEGEKIHRPNFRIVPPSTTREQ